MQVANFKDHGLILVIRPWVEAWGGHGSKTRLGPYNLNNTVPYRHEFAYQSVFLKEAIWKLV